MKDPVEIFVHLYQLCSMFAVVFAEFFKVYLSECIAINEHLISLFKLVQPDKVIIKPTKNQQNKQKHTYFSVFG